MRYFVAGFTAFLLVSCGGGSKSYVKNGEISKTLDQSAVQKTYLEAVGIGAADQTLTNTTQRRATSRNAGIVAAQYEMLSMVKGVQLEGGITVEKAMETDSHLETTIKETIKGADIVKSEWTNDDGCVVTIRLDRKRLQDQMGVKFK